MVTEVSHVPMAVTPVPRMVLPFAVVAAGPAGPTGPAGPALPGVP